MKISILIIALFSLLVLVSMTPQQPMPSAPNLDTKNYLLEHLNHLQKALVELDQAANDQVLDQAKSAYSTARASFKRIEFLVAYLDPQLYTRELNESPLLKPTPKVPSKEVRHPKGFQCLDEHLFGEEVLFEEVLKHSQHLQLVVQGFTKRMQKVQLYDALILHAIKEQLLRSFTLGLTGFDTPSSSLALKDFEDVNIGISTILSYYKERFSTVLVERVQALLQTKPTTDFDNFDRYGYLVETLIPLLEQLEAIRTDSYLASREELIGLPLPFKSDFTNPFQKDFFNASYYTNIPVQEQTAARIALGERLFNDPILSNNLLTSCATCHKKKIAFTDQLKRSKNGDKSQTTNRNSPSLNYAVYASAYFYDLRAHDLKNQFDHVIHDHKEFNSNYKEIIQKLTQEPTYNQAFSETYAHYPQSISNASINHALKCYLMSLPKFDSPFDQWVQQKQTMIPTDVRQGFNLFMGKAQCGTCHFPPTFSGLVPPHYKESESEVLGILTNEDFKHPVLDGDLGRKNNGILKDHFDFFERSFKTVSIRNAEKTAPYMHNGSIKSLEKVIEFYDLGGAAGMGISLNHQTLPADPLNLSQLEKKALIAFIHSLTDSNKK